MSERADPTPGQRRRVVGANADRCCVCKRTDVGLHLHHIDGDSANTVDENLAVLCVEDHDRHHRPGAYPKVRHLELGAAKIAESKASWEAFVAEARQPSPCVLATLTYFGTHQEIHSAQLVMQWPDQRIEYVRSYHLLDGNFQTWTECILAELHSVGKKMTVAVLEEPQPIEHCPCCGVGFSHTVGKALAYKLTDPDWATQSLCAVYVNPDQPSLAIALNLRGEHLWSGSLHLCQGRSLHFACDAYEERFPLADRPSVRIQAGHIVGKVIREWAPAQVLYGTGSPGSPSLIGDLDLPECWERLAA